MPSFYEILGIPEALQDGPGISAQTVRSAYRRALLKNHPDKSKPSAKPSSAFDRPLYSIDQISEAFSTLSDPKLRARYDGELRVQIATADIGKEQGRPAFQTGVETVDLDDLSVEEDTGTWYRGCRCGDERGFLIREADLEEAANDGELSVGCNGCSLWLKVQFAVVEES